MLWIYYLRKQYHFQLNKKETKKNFNKNNIIIYAKLNEDVLFTIFYNGNINTFTISIQNSNTRKLKKYRYHYHFIYHNRL